MEDETKRNGCMLCPRRCQAPRGEGKKGVCGCDAKLKVARAALHMWEEPCISGTRGSGAVFFSGCPLHCCYCQNRAISDGVAGKVIDEKRLTEIFLELQEKGAANINLVTVGHCAEQAVRALKEAKLQGLSIPVIVNSGGYENVETVELLSEVTDAWLPDLKYLRPETAERFSRAFNYPEVAKAAIDAMVRLTGPVAFDGDGYLKSGVVVRHLVLPGHVDESKEVVSYLYDRYGERIYLSLLNQYTPPAEPLPFKELNRRLTTYEYEQVTEFALFLGITKAYVQERGTAKESFIPPFDCEGV